jgi:hypothetical protein
VPAVARATPIFAGYPAPGGTSHSSTGPAGGGGTRTYSGFDPTQWDMLYFGFTIVDGPINSTSPPGTSQPLTFDSFIGSGATREAIWKSDSQWTYNAGFGNQSAPVRFRNTFTDMFGNNITDQAVLASTVGISGTPYVLPFDELTLDAWGDGFKAIQRIEAFVGGSWVLVNQVNSVCSGCTSSGTGGSFWYEPAAVPESGGSLMLMGTGLLALCLASRTRYGRGQESMSYDTQALKGKQCR